MQEIKSAKLDIMYTQFFELDIQPSETILVYEQTLQKSKKVTNYMKNEYHNKIGKKSFFWHLLTCNHVLWKENNLLNIAS